MTQTAAGRMGATAASSINFYVPVVALALGVGLRGERVSGISIAGAAVWLDGALRMDDPARTACRQVGARKAAYLILTP